VSSEQEKNKALAHRFLEATARGDLDAMDEMMAPEFADRSLMPGQEPDREGSRTRKRTAGSCAPWATRSRRYGVSSAPVGRRSEYRNSASATAIPRYLRWGAGPCQGGTVDDRAARCSSAPSCRRYATA
jgi:hypothetical protein